MAKAKRKAAPKRAVRKKETKFNFPTSDIGRPSDYTDEMADYIVKELAKGPSLRSICAAPNMPHESTVRAWAVRDPHGFGARYAAARQLQMEAMEDEIRHVASNQRGDVNRDRLHVDALKWTMSKVAPKKYGDRSTREVVGDGGGPVKIDVTEMSDEKLARLEAVLSDVIGGTDRPSSESETGTGEEEA